MNDTLWLSPESYRLMKLMYSDEGFWEVANAMKDSDGWLIVPFKDPPVLCEIEDQRWKMIVKTVLRRFVGEYALPDYKWN